MGPRSCNLLVLLCSPPPEAAGLIERWDGFVKTQSQHQGDGSNQEGWSRALQVVSSLNQHTLSPMVSPILRILGSRNQRVEKEIFPLTTNQWSTGKIFTSCSYNLKLFWSRNFGSKGKLFFQESQQTSHWPRTSDLALATWGFWCLYANRKKKKKE